MDRRTFGKLAGVAVLGSFAESTVVQAESSGTAINGGTSTGEEVVLQDGELLVAFDKGSGALTRLERKSTHWMIARRPELGVSFRLLVPLPHRRANFILGQSQRAARVEKVSDSQIELEWKDPVSEHGGVVPLTFTATVTLENGVLTFAANLVNRSPLTIETVDYPYFGDLNTPAHGESMQAEHMWYGNLDSAPLSSHIQKRKRLLGG